MFIGRVEVRVRDRVRGSARGRDTVGAGACVRVTVRGGSQPPGARRAR